MGERHVGYKTNAMPQRPRRLCLLAIVFQVAVLSMCAQPVRASPPGHYPSESRYTHSFRCAGTSYTVKYKLNRSGSQDNILKFTEVRQSKTPINMALAERKANQLLYALNGVGYFRFVSFGCVDKFAEMRLLTLGSLASERYAVLTIDLFEGGAVAMYSRTKPADFKKIIGGTTVDAAERVARSMGLYGGLEK